jgi:hypothetical protein
LYASKLDADVIESYYYDMNECDIHATSDALRQVVKEVDELEELQAQSNIDSSLTKLQTEYLMNSISDDIAVADITAGANIIVSVFACPIQAQHKMFEVEHFPKPSENFPHNFKVKYLSASYWKSSKSRKWFTDTDKPQSLCGIIFNPKSVEIIAGSPGDAYSSTYYKTRKNEGVLTDQVRQMQIADPENYMKRYNQNLQNYIRSFRFNVDKVKMNEEFCKKYILNDSEGFNAFVYTAVHTLCIKNRLDKKALLEYVSASKEMNEVVIAPDANDVIGFFALPQLKNSKSVNRAADDSSAMAQTFNENFNRNVKAFRCVDQKCSKLALVDEKLRR